MRIAVTREDESDIGRVPCHPLYLISLNFTQFYIILLNFTQFYLFSAQVLFNLYLILLIFHSIFYLPSLNFILSTLLNLTYFNFILSLSHFPLSFYNYFLFLTSAIFINFHRPSQPSHSFILPFFPNGSTIFSYKYLSYQYSINKNYTFITFPFKNWLFHLVQISFL